MGVKRVECVRAQGDSGLEPDDADEPKQLEQEMGDVGAAGDVVDERLWSPIGLV